MKLAIQTVPTVAAVISQGSGLSSTPAAPGKSFTEICASKMLVESRNAPGASVPLGKAGSSTPVSPRPVPLAKLALPSPSKLPEKSPTVNTTSVSASLLPLAEPVYPAEILPESPGDSPALAIAFKSSDSDSSNPTRVDAFLTVKSVAVGAAVPNDCQCVNYENAPPASLPVAAPSESAASQNSAPQVSSAGGGADPSEAAPNWTSSSASPASVTAVLTPSSSETSEAAPDSTLALPVPSLQQRTAASTSTEDSSPNPEIYTAANQEPETTPVNLLNSLALNAPAASVSPVSVPSLIESSHVTVHTLPVEGAGLTKVPPSTAPKVSPSRPEESNDGRSEASPQASVRTQQQSAQHAPIFSITFPLEHSSPRNASVNFSSIAPNRGSFPSSAAVFSGTSPSVQGPASAVANTHEGRNESGNSPSDNSAGNSSAPALHASSDAQVSVPSQSVTSSPAVVPPAVAITDPAVSSSAAREPVSASSKSANSPDDIGMNSFPDATPHSASDASSTLPSTSPVQMAQVVSRTAQSEMRIGLNTSSFGNIEVRTIVHATDAGVMIGSEKGDLRSLLAPELHGVASALQQQNLKLAHISFQQQGFGFSSDSAGANAHPRSFAGKGNVPCTSPSDAAALEINSEPQYGSAKGEKGLSILA